MAKTGVSDFYSIFIPTSQFGSLHNYPIQEQPMTLAVDSANIYHYFIWFR
jgi:hypothetical protein